MSRYRRRVRDDLVDVVYDVIRSAAAPEAPLDEAALRAQAEREAARQAAKAEARRRREERDMRSFAGVGAGLMAGGLSSMIMPTPAAVGVGLLAGGIVTLLIRYVQERGLPRMATPRPQRPPKPADIAPPEVDGRNLARSQRDLIQGVLDDAADHMRALDACARRLDRPDPASAELCRRLVRTGDKLSDVIAETPAKFAIAQRLFTYNLPKAVYVAETLCDLPEGAPPRRAEEARHVLTRLDMVFEKTLLDLSEVDAAEMDLEMRLINQSLDEELKGNDGGKTP
ncbi:MAG: 5-bromo-4-chloroindolyl phosphate hydrolysis family protein [Hyphomonadaceae bacterium]|nr:5-bromo-4-chloroindolyl phosphate hydrolysis family protein [Hyphomonadaceae bacterium]